jgi:hypothetical protein
MIARRRICCSLIRRRSRSTKQVRNADDEDTALIEECVSCSDGGGSRDRVVS